MVFVLHICNKRDTSCFPVEDARPTLEVKNQVLQHGHGKHKLHRIYIYICACVSVCTYIHKYGSEDGTQNKHNFTQELRIL